MITEVRSKLLTINPINNSLNFLIQLGSISPNGSIGILDPGFIWQIRSTLSPKMTSSKFFTTFLAPSCTNRRKLVIQSWAAGSTPKVVESSTRVAVHDHLDAWKAMQNLFSCPDNFLV